MDDSKKTLEYLISVEKLADDILGDRRSLVLLDKRKNENREALRAVKGQESKKCWLTIGSNIVKCSTSHAIEFLEKDQAQIDEDIDRIRIGLKIKVNKLRDLEHEPPVPGLMLVPLSQDESRAMRNTLTGLR